jgi:hypothetical protein
VSVGVGIGLGLAGISLGLWALLKQPRGDLRECVWCDRMISLPGRACSTICDHELKHLALSHPDEICRAELQEMEYQFFGDARKNRATQESE